MSPNYPSACEVIRGEFYFNAIAFREADLCFLHLASEVAHYFVVVMVV